MYQSFYIGVEYPAKSLPRTDADAMHRSRTVNRPTNGKLEYFKENKIKNFFPKKGSYAWH